MQRLRALGCLIAVATATAAGASSFVAEDTPAQFRAAVVDVARGAVYAAIYDRGEVWQMDPATRQRAGRAIAGRGACALALSSDGAFLACANRLDNTVSIFSPGSMALLLTVPAGDGPADIAALPGGGFAVANSFSDSVTLLNPRTGEWSTLPHAPAVPAALAAGDAFLAVAGVAAPELRLFPHDGGEHTGVHLPAAPSAVEALPGNRFAVLAEGALVLIDAARGTVTRRVELDAADIAAHGGGLLVLADSELLVLDTDLNISDRHALSGPARRIAAAGGVYVALDPRTRSWQVWNAANLAYTPAAEALPAVQPPPAPAPADTPTPPAAPPGNSVLVVEAQPAATPDTPAPVETFAAAEMPPAEAPGTPAPLPAPPREERVLAEKTEATEPAASTAPTRTAPQQAAAGRSANPRSQMPGLGDETRAPRLRQRPSAVPIEDLSGQSLSDALEAGADFGPAESLFETPDWSQPLRDLEADELGGTFDRDVIEAEGNVRLRLGETLFRADYFTFRQSTGEMHAKGNVVMQQPESLLTADEIFYTLPPDRTLPPPPPLTTESEQDQAKRRLSQGRLEAFNLRIEEPLREMTAAQVDYNAMTGEGELHGVRGRTGQFYFGAERLEMLGPKTMQAENIWVTTCDTDPAPYRIAVQEVRVEDGRPVLGKHARMQIRNWDTPIYLPRWQPGASAKYPWAMDFDSGRRADLGFFVNVGQRFQFTPDIAAGPRLFVTQDEGAGLGGDVHYDFMETPASPLYRTEGEAHGLYTTEERGYLHWYHRYEHSDDLVVRMQAEHWGDRDFYKDFYYEEFRDRTTPRTFANVTYTQPSYIATGTARVNTHRWIAETERLPEGSFHLLERELFPHAYLSFDTITGHNDRQPRGGHAMRSVNVARLTGDVDFTEALSLTPFWELDTTWYSSERDDDGSAFRVGNTVGVTGQSRLHRVYGGRWGFSAFKHVIVPSVTYSYRPSPTLDAEDTPIFDAFDTAFGRSRLESKLDNIVFGKDAESGEVWQVARLTLYQGNDFWNEFSKSEDYEIEVDIRPRPWWGFQMVAERHKVARDLDLDDPFFLERINLRAYEALFGRPYDPEADFQFNAAFSDYDRMLAQLYYNDEMLGGRFQGRIGFAYTETRGRVFNREVLYGLGYQLTGKWGVAFEHRYDFESGSLRTQSYEVRRKFNCWETALRVRDRESGTDIDLEFSISAFPGSRVKF